MDAARLEASSLMNSFWNKSLGVVMGGTRVPLRVQDIRQPP